MNVAGDANCCTESDRYSESHSYGESDRCAESDRYSESHSYGESDRCAESSDSAQRTITRRIKDFLSILSIVLFASCTHIDVYEKSVAIPGHSWQSSFKPSFQFTIKDSQAVYQAFLVLRHTEKYNFNNIYLNLLVKGPSSDSIIKITKDVTLADNEGWKAASGMDDVYEHQLPLGDVQALKPGDYTFTLEQIMREDPLQHVLNAGIRIERK